MSFVCLQAQDLTTLRKKSLLIDSLVLSIDSLPIVANSELLKIDGIVLDSNEYDLNYVLAKITFKSEKYLNKNLEVVYRFIDFDFNKKYYRKDAKKIEQIDPGLPDFYSIKPEENKKEIFDLGGLNKSGSISRGITFGNNQNLAVNSNLDLQLSGKLTDDINIRAAISDDNIPIQAEGNTQQLREFDQVFIQIYNETFELTAGDFRIKRPKSYFLSFDKKLQGGSVKTHFLLDKKIDEKVENRAVMNSQLSVAISKGKFARNVLNGGQANGGIGTEGNQGPYRLRGAENETFIIILSGTEKVYVNGKLLKRGQDFDYIIDYNSAEITFTPNQLITKDARIIVEFQYSERNYSRSLIYANNTFSKKNLELRLNIYSEQDNKQQPLLQELSEEDKILLNAIGDNVNQALISGIDTVAQFEADQVFYKKIDSLGFADILVYSINPDSAKFRVNFSEVPFGEGDYVRIQSAANGKVFKWVAPILGVRQGNYIPFVLLITPKKTQMATFGGTYKIRETTTLSFEGAVSQRDINTFSNLDNNNDQGYGIELKLDHKSLIVKKENKAAISFLGGFHYEQKGSYFNPIERYRDVEFERDWNISTLQLSGNQYLGNAYAGLELGDKGSLTYQLGTFINQNDYEGIKHAYNANYAQSGYKITSNGSYLTTKGLINSNFLRHYTTITKDIKPFIVGIYGDQEKAVYNLDSNKIGANSNNKLEWRVFVKTADTTTNSYEISYGQRYDYLARTEDLDLANKAEDFKLAFLLAKNPASRLKGQAIYRKLQNLDSNLSKVKAENTIIGRLDYALKLWKGFISSNTFYEISSGLENKREFSYLKVSDGQGIYLWIDYNNNGIKELNEFEVAGKNNSFQANYIRVFTPTNNYTKVFNNQFNEILFIKPEVFLSNRKGLLNLVSKLSNKTTYRVERKTANDDDIYNPFVTSVADTSLVTVNSSLSNTLYINRLGIKFGTDLFYQINKSKNLLTNGFESREVINREIRSRYNLTNTLTINTTFAYNEKKNNSEFFANRDYQIISYEAQPKLTYQSGVQYRISLFGEYVDKENLLGEERTFNRTIGTEFQYSKAGKGNLSLEIRYINIIYNSPANSALAYEMLDGLKDGSNATWSINWQKNLSNNLQLSVNYNGRKSKDLNTIHSGGMSLRAFF